ATLGIYSIAVNLSGAAQQVLQEVCQWILMPIFSKVQREDSSRLREIFDKVRSRVDMLIMPAVGLLIATGDLIVHLIWPARAAGAGWMLQVLGVGVACFY